MALVLLPLPSETLPTSTLPWDIGPHAGLRPVPCSAEHAAEILARLEHNYLTTQVFLDFGRLFRPGRVAPGPLHRVLLVDLERHTRFLAASLEQIHAAFRASGGAAPLFVLTADGALLIHAMTRLSIATICRRTNPAQPA